MAKFTAILAIIVALAATRASATPIISDPLTGSGDLFSSAPQTDTYNPGDTWLAYPAPTTLPSNFARTASGTTVAADNNFFPGGQGSAASAASLAFVPTAGNIYMLQATVTVTGGNAGDWAFLGFGGSQSDTFIYSNNADVPGPWMLIRSSALSGQQADDIQTFSNGESNSADYTGANSGSIDIPQTLSMVLNTTAAHWKISYYENGGLLGSFTYSGSNPTTIGSVNFGEYVTTTATFTSFSLTLVPEPSSITLLGLGAIGCGVVLLQRRHARKLNGAAIKL